MSKGILASSKPALIFAGVTLMFAVVMAVSMGSRFTPKASDAYATDEAAESETESVAARETEDASTETEAVFGDFGSFAEDAELIDDTAGFDPSPDQTNATIVSPATASSGTSSDRSEDSSASGESSGQELRKQSSRTRRPAVPQPRGKPIEGITVEQLKRDLRGPPKISTGPEQEETR